uniref:Uncharacterized protein n=1 Tax=Anguilla anguilla TaxID=7936 RepID=A0A0E9W2W6_ANGAN
MCLQMGLQRNKLNTLNCTVIYTQARVLIIMLAVASLAVLRKRVGGRVI